MPTPVRRIVSPDTLRAVRVPPGQTETKKFPVLDLGVQPTIPTAKWNLHVWGAVDAETKIPWADFQKMPHVEVVADFHCVTTWSRLGLVWQGVSFRELVARVRPKPTATHVVAHGEEGYTTNIPLSDLKEDDVLVVDALDGEAIPREHGGPVRLLVPRLYAWKSCKFLIGLEFKEGDAPGFWEVRGYHNRGDPWKEERYG